MAIYYLNVQIIGRSARTYDYTRRRGDIETEILAPAGAPAWVQDRAQLWNQVEKAEKRGNAPSQSPWSWTGRSSGI